MPSGAPAHHQSVVDRTNPKRYESCSHRLLQEYTEEFRDIAKGIKSKEALPAAPITLIHQRPVAEDVHVIVSLIFFFVLSICFIFHTHFITHTNTRSHAQTFHSFIRLFFLSNGFAVFLLLC